MCGPVANRDVLSEPVCNSVAIRVMSKILAKSILLLILVPLCRAERPFFITYTAQMEEPGNLELAMKNVTGNPGGGNRFFAAATEFEYGLKGWWTTEFYLD